MLTPEPWQEIARGRAGHHSPKAYSSDLIIETTKVWYPGTFLGIVKFNTVGVIKEYF